MSVDLKKHPAQQMGTRSRIVWTQGSRQVREILQTTFFPKNKAIFPWKLAEKRELKPKNKTLFLVVAMRWVKGILSKKCSEISAEIFLEFLGNPRKDPGNSHSLLEFFDHCCCESHGQVWWVNGKTTSEERVQAVLGGGGAILEMLWASNPQPKPAPKPAIVDLL